MYTLFSTKHWQDARATLFMFLGGVTVTFAPWLARNLRDTGNPVYPLLWPVLGGDSWNAEQNARWQQAHRPAGHSRQQLVSDAHRVLLASDALSPLLFALAPLALLTNPRRRVLAIAGSGVWILAAWWLFTHRIDRFWYPAIPLFALLAGLAATPIVGNRFRTARTLALTLPMILSFGQCLTSHPGWLAHGGLVYTIDLNVARQQFRRPSAQLCGTMPPGAKLLVLGEAAVFDVEQAVFYHTAFDDDPLSVWLGSDPASASPEAVHQALVAHGVSHVYVDWREIARYRSAGSYGYSEWVRPHVFQEWQRAGVLAAPRIEERPWDALPSELQRVFQGWPELISQRDDTRVVTAYAIFPVRQP